MFEEDKVAGVWTGEDDKKSVMASHVKGVKKARQQEVGARPGDIKHKGVFGKEKVFNYYGKWQLTGQLTSWRTTFRRVASPR
jgi:hypothetical protein